MTACFKLMKALQPKIMQQPEHSICEPCVYFSRNLDLTTLQSIAPSAQPDACGLGFIPGDDGCNEMRTSNCSTRKR
ncbi:MAG TPA: hypothetical protein VL087_06345 [Nitrospirota bacterium]|nr:hypothetical protein [Nitrospirota bacterium]